MKQTELVDAFLKGATEGDANSLHVVGDQLIHYQTPIAERHGGRVILNYTRYSLATGKVQKMVTDRVPTDKLIYVKGIDGNFEGTLAQFCESEEPSEYLARAHHKSLGDGYVLSIGDGKLVASFRGKTREFMYPDVVERGLITILGEGK